MKDWIISADCESRAHCASCRLLPAWRDQIAASGLFTRPPEVCPWGVAASDVSLTRSECCAHKWIISTGNGIPVLLIPVHNVLQPATMPFAGGMTDTEFFVIPPDDPDAQVMIQNVGSQSIWVDATEVLTGQSLPVPAGPVMRKLRCHDPKVAD